MREELIEIEQDLQGFNSFLGSWLCKDEHTVVVDVGPANTAGRLIRSLVSKGVERVDYVLLTHIHIDHAGGLADLLDYYPMAKVVCHEKAAKYLADPSKLWTGSLEVLGEIAKLYGPPRPVPMEKVIPHTQMAVEDLIVMETPGHAAHHLSFSYKNRLFAGEASGNYFVVGGTEYLRPATPPRFFLDVCQRSVESLLGLDDQPICFGHFGKAESSHRLLKMSRDQLTVWERVISGEMQKGWVDLAKRCINALFEKDRYLKAFDKMDPEVQKRERFFMANSVQGFIGFIEKDG
jgi:glyoxylase-like metal-dependent hydrolase (beta-lactamase superfamily II)